MTDYYSVPLKFLRFDELRANRRVSAYRHDINDQKAMKSLFACHQIDTVIHLAAQAGVRYSEVNPAAYATANLLGTTNMFEYAKQFSVKHVLYASSSSVYSGSTEMPYREDMVLARPLSYYAITKLTNEMMAEHLTRTSGIPTTGLRFFTAYGPMGRPDMAYWKFTEDILAGRTIKVYGDGNVMRDFTYCDDVTRAVELLLDTPSGDQVYNIGNSQPEKVTGMIAILEELLGKRAIIESTPLPASDPAMTFCDNTKLHEATGFRPSTSLRYGLEQFVTWYQETKHLIQKD
jgi:UDP-glucuronate 4-epimerase